MLHRTLPRALSLAFVLAAASLGPLLFAGTVFAAAPKDAAGEPAAAKAEAPAEARPAKPKGKAKSKAKKGTPSKAHAPAKARTKAAKTASKPAKGKAKRNPSREHKPAAKRAKPAAPKAADADSPRAGDTRSPAPCLGPVVALDRAGAETERLPLVDCKGAALDSASTRLAVLARPSGVTRESHPTSSHLDPGLVARVDALARKFPGQTLTIVAAPPPSAGTSSAHHDGRAVDLRIDGVDATKLAEICRTLADTGCGFYPNAGFIHLDVRPSGAGKSSWIDASEPGDPPRYVASWPPRAAPPKPAPAAR